MFGLLYSWFLVLLVIWISWTKTKTLPNLRLPISSGYIRWKSRNMHGRRECAIRRLRSPFSEMFTAIVRISAAMWIGSLISSSPTHMLWCQWPWSMLTLPCPEGGVQGLQGMLWCWSDSDYQKSWNNSFWQFPGKRIDSCPGGRNCYFFSWDSFLSKESWLKIQNPLTQH